MPRRPTIFLPLVIVLALFTTSCASSHPSAAETDPTIAISAYRQGIAEAIQEIRDNSPTIYTSETPATELDPVTNFPYRAMGGATTPSQLWRLLGHNDFIRGYVGAPLGPPVPH